MTNEPKWAPTKYLVGFRRSEEEMKVRLYDTYDEAIKAIKESPVHYKFLMRGRVLKRRYYPTE